MASIAANSVQFLVNGRENGMGTDTQFSMSEIAKGGWQSDRIKRLRLRVARSKRKCVGSIAAHPCKKRKDGAPTFRYGKGKTERGEGWASPQEPTDKGNGRSFTAVPR